MIRREWTICSSCFHRCCRTQYDCQTSFFGGTAPLSQAYGYSIVVLFGVAFSVITSIIVWLEYKCVSV